MNVNNFFQKLKAVKKQDEVVKRCCFVSNVDNLTIAVGKCQPLFFIFLHLFIESCGDIEEDPGETA